jgi:WD40 repeat protein
LFSPDGEKLLTGSADGTSVIWDTRFIEKPISVEEVSELQPLSLKNIEISEAQVIYRFEEKNISSSTECLIDGIEWSVTGRYAYCGISVKEVAKGSDQQKPAKVKIKVYDTYSGEVIESLDLACKLKTE